MISKDRVFERQSNISLVGAGCLLTLVLLLNACGFGTNLEDKLVYEPVLPPLGFILEYEISPDAQVAAVLVPTNAAQPGSSGYAAVFDSLWDDLQILVFDLTEDALVSRSPLYDNVTNLRWVGDSQVLLYLAWPDSGSSRELVRWDLQTGERIAHEFPHSGFDLRDDGQVLAAWGRESLAIHPNILRLYSFPQLNQLSSIRVPEISNIYHADWASDGTWLLLDTGPEIWRLNTVSEEVAKIVDSGRVNVYPTLLDPLSRFLLGSGNGITLFDIEQDCVVFDLEAQARYNEYEQGEWAQESGLIYLVLRENKEAQQTILRTDVSDILEESHHACLSEN